MLDIKENIILAPLTTFKIGGPAKYFVEADSKEELLKAINWAQQQDEKFFILAGGSNVLFSDKGYNGLIIKLNIQDIVINNNIVKAGAGARLSKMIMKACENGLSGMENMYGIPGTVGGAVRGNAGAFGIEVKNVLKNVYALNAKTKESKKFTNKECDFNYRTSLFKQNPEWIILKADFELIPKNVEECVNDANKISDARNKKHLQDVQAAGSFFFNPIAPKWVQELFEKDKKTKSRGGKVPAGYLIDKAGLRGKARVGGAFSSDQHADYIINTGDATANDVKKLMNKIKKTVKEKFDVELKEEVQIVNF